MRKLGPGMYLDNNSSLHVSERELCEYFNVPYTEENCRTIERGAKDAIKKLWGKLPPTTIRHGDEPQQTRFRKENS
jgi:hypothetical protein